MVDQSELAWRLLSRSPLPPDMAGPSSTVTGSTGKVFTRHQGGAHLVYTPMINAKSFAQSKAGLKGMDPYYNTAYGEEGCSGTVAGVEGGDAPVFVQVSLRIVQHAAGSGWTSARPCEERALIAVLRQ